MKKKILNSPAIITVLRTLNIVKIGKSHAHPVDFTFMLPVYNMYGNLQRRGRRGIISIIKVEKFLWFYFYENYLHFILPHTINYIIYIIICDVIGVSQTEYPHHVCRRPFC